MSKAVSVVLFVVFGVVCGVGGFYFGKVTAYSGLVKAGVGVFERDGRFQIKDSVREAIKDRRANKSEAPVCPCVCDDCKRCDACVCDCTCTDCTCPTSQTKI